MRAVCQVHIYVHVQANMCNVCVVEVDMAEEKTYGSSTLILPMHYSSIFLLSPIIFFGVTSLFSYAIRNIAL